MKRVCGLILLLSLLGCSPKSENNPPQQPTTPPTGANPQAEPAKSADTTAAPPIPGFTNAPPEQIATLTVVDGGKCSVDSVNQSESPTGWTIRRGDMVTMGGWVLDVNTKTTSNWAVMRLDAADGSTQFYFPTTWRGERPDLAQVFGSGPGLSKVTFALTAATDRISKGTYKLTVLHQSTAGGQACSVQKTLTVE